MPPERIERTPSSAQLAAAPIEKAAPLLAWRVHLLRRYPNRIPVLALTLLIALLGVYMMFGNPLLALVAVLLLIGATSEFIFPIAYRLTEEGIEADTLTARMKLPWKDARRCLCDRRSVTLSPLAQASRLDGFRGVTLRFAPNGEPGDRDSVLAIIARCAPALLAPNALEETPQAQNNAETTN